MGEDTMKKFIALITTLIPIASYADDYQLVNFNKFECAQTSNYEFNVCIKNNTGNDILPSQIFLNYAYTEKYGGGSAGGSVPFSIWKANTYITIEVAKKFFEPSSNHETLNQVKFFLTKDDYFKGVSGCKVTWLDSSPPNSTPATLVLERNGNDYYCHD
jgi:hypothetical protein